MNITRRGFISMLALAGTGAVLLPNRKIFLPPTRDFFAEYCAKYGHGDFTTENLRFKCTERYSQAWTDPRMVFGVQPRKLVVPPNLVKAAHRILGEPLPGGFTVEVSKKYLTPPAQTWYLKTGSDDPKVVELFERLAHGAGMQTTREFYGTKSQGQG